MDDANPNPDDESDAVLLAFGDGDRLGAMERARTWLATHPDDSRMWTNVAAFHFDEGRDAEGLTAIRRAATIDPDDLDAWFLYAIAPTPPDGDDEERLLAARQMIRLAPAVSEGYYIECRLLRARGDLNAALDVLELMHRNVPGPDSPLPGLDAPPTRSAHLLPGVIVRSYASLTESDWPDVRIAALTWSQLDPGSARAWFHRGLAEFREYHYDRAVPLLRRVTEIDPTHLEGWIALSYAIRNSGGSVAEQQEAAHRALALDPDDPHARRAVMAGPAPTFDPDVRDHWPSFVAAFATLACLLGWFVAHQGGLGTARPPSRPGQPWAGLLLTLPVLALVVTGFLAVLGGGRTILRAVGRTTCSVYCLSVVVTLLSGWLLLAPRDVMQHGANIAYPALWVLAAPLVLGTLLGWRFLTAGRISGQ